MNQPTKTLRFVFWILLGFLSTFFAEALSGASPDFFFKDFGYIGIFPIYALHSLLLAALVIRKDGRFSLRTLYLVGLLFGMYEAYITKVLWQPPWSTNTFRVAGLAVFETLMLVFNWHAFFSFILPLFWIEGLLLGSNHLAGRLPGKWHKRLISFRGAGLTGLIGGILCGYALPGPVDALRLILADCLIITCLLAFWKGITHGKRFDLADLLPHRWSVVVLGILLFIDYLALGLTLNRDVHPGLVGHAAVLALYGGFGLLICFSMRRDRKDKEALDVPLETESEEAKGYTFKHWLVFCLVLCAAAFLINLLPPDFQNLVAGLGLLATTITGVIVFFACGRSLLKSRGDQKIAKA